MKLYIIAIVLCIEVTCGLSLFLALHILNDPMNTGYLHLGAVGVLPLFGALFGYIFPRGR